MPYGCPANTLIEYLDFRGTEASNANFKFDKRNTKEQDYEQQVADVTWASLTAEIAYVDASGRVAIDGDVFSRRCEENPDPDGDPIPVEPWSYFSKTTEMRGRLHKVNPNREQRNTPGTPMKNPVGIVLQDANGVPIITPGPGEHDRDEYSGALLFNEDGTDKLVPV